MINNIKREQSLLGLFLPYSHRELIVRLKGWRKILVERYQHLDVREWRYLEFDFTNGNKRLVYFELARAISNGWCMRNNISDIARYMAVCSNIADNDDFDIRVKTIRQGIHRQMKYFNKSKDTKKNGNIIVTACEGQVAEAGQCERGGTADQGRSVA